MHLTLKLLNGEVIERTIKATEVTIGRSPKCDLQIPQDGMSRQHCKIEVSEGEVFVTDMNSTNGVYIDGERIENGKKTSYQTFLTLSFGAVQSLQVETDDSKAPLEETPLAASTPIMASDRVNLTKTRRIAPPKKPEKVKKKTELTAEKIKTYIVNFLAFLILLGAYYLYMEKEEAPVNDEIEYTVDENVETF